MKITRRPDTGNRPPKIEFLDDGKLEAIFLGEVTEEIFGEDVVVLSAQPDFRLSSRIEGATGLPEDRARKTSAMLATSLQEDNYGVVTPRLQWEGFAGYRVDPSSAARDRSSLSMASPHTPFPLRLLNWAKDWRNFVIKLPPTNGPSARAHRIRIHLSSALLDG